MQEKYNKPDDQKDLTEAEVGPPCSLYYVIEFCFNVVRQ